jgi:preprotein translocase subunit SecF
MKERAKTVPTERPGAKTTPPANAPRFFELIPAQTNIDFVRLAPRMVMLSVLFIVVGLVSMYLRGGLNYGIDFTGGTLVQVRFPQATSINDVRTALDRPEAQGAVVQEVGREGHDFQIRLSEAEAHGAGEAVRAGLRDKFGDGGYEILSVEAVGPKVGQDLWRGATLAVLASTLMMGIYIAIRFDLRFGVGVAVALLHNVLFALAALSLVNLEFDLTTVAALLTIVGFSVNDNVVISDRIRENMGKMRRADLATVLNVAINETLSRTIINSGTVIFVATALFVLGGTVIHSFAFTLLVGFIIGTYSSIFVSTPIVLLLDRRRGRPARAAA